MLKKKIQKFLTVMLLSVIVNPTLMSFTFYSSKKLSKYQVILDSKIFLLNNL